LALESRLAADILAAAVAPTWNQIGKPGAIAIIGTVGPLRTLFRKLLRLN